uniref:Nitrilase n=1 Tax=uncultured organism TaxID=155900 RepID=Q6RWL9_9ZZZZ|nr:nitrilase [uncultured organism]
MAAVQAAPVPFDAEASVDKACRLIQEAAAKGADIVAFGEAWLPGYPYFAWLPQVTPEWYSAAADYLASSVDIPGPITDKLCQAARRASVELIMGVVERSKSQGTTYCTLLFISKDGEIIGKHRKLKPTLAERTVWGEGDASGLRVHDRPIARISGLSCWENKMMLPGYALMAQGTQVHVSAWPGIPEDSPMEVPAHPRQKLLSQAFALQGGCYVISPSIVLRAEDVPEKHAALLMGDQVGGSYIIDPCGKVIAEAGAGETILIAKGNLDLVRAAKMASDVGGSYSRPDLLQLMINNRPLEQLIEFSAEGAGRGNLVSNSPEVSEQEGE